MVIAIAIEEQIAIRITIKLSLMNWPAVTGSPEVFSSVFEETISEGWEVSPLEPAELLPFEAVPEPLLLAESLFGVSPEPLLPPVEPLLPLPEVLLLPPPEVEPLLPPEEVFPPPEVEPLLPLPELLLPLLELVPLLELLLELLLS